MRADAEGLAAYEHDRPTHRHDCLPGGVNEARPCPWASCSHHLLFDVNAKTGSLKMNFPGRGVEDMPAGGSCSLDVADQGGVTLEVAGRYMNLSREWVRQIEEEVAVRLQGHEMATGVRALLRESDSLYRPRGAGPLAWLETHDGDSTSPKPNYDRLAVEVAIVDYLAGRPDSTTLQIAMAHRMDVEKTRGIVVRLERRGLVRHTAVPNPKGRGRKQYLYRIVEGASKEGTGHDGDQHGGAEPGFRE